MMKLIFVHVVLAASASMIVAQIPADEAPAIARFRDGAITAQELSSWAQHRKTGGARGDSDVNLLIDELVMLHVLADRFQSMGLNNKPANSALLELQRWELSEKSLRSDVIRTSHPSDANVKADFLAEPDRYARPQQWQLENILKKWPEPCSKDQRTALQQQMETVRQRLVDGEDFAALARDESQSQTRLRGGRMGLASLDELQPEVAKIVAEMAEGSLSPIIETSEGLTLLRCTRVFEAKSGTFENARDTISKRLRRERFENAWEALDLRLLAELRPVYHLEVITFEMPDQTPVVTLNEGDKTRIVTLGDYRAFLVRKHLSQDAVDDDRNLELIEARVLLEAHAHEAKRRGLDDDASQAEHLEWVQLELKARIALDAITEPLVKAPSNKEIEDLYSRRGNELIQPEKLHLKALEIPIDRNLPRGFYDNFEHLAAKLGEGKITLEAAVRELAPHATVQDLGLRTLDQVWVLGRNATHAIEGLEPGQWSGPVQEGPSLRVYLLVARRPQRQLTLAEARPRLEAAMIAARRQKAEEMVRQTILEEQKIEVTP